jgi:fructoselysine transporter
VILLYRKIEAIGKISIVLWVGVLVTMLWIIFGGGLAHGNFYAPHKHINDGINLNYAFVAAIGFASVKSVYSYLGIIMFAIWVAKLLTLRAIYRAVCLSL